MKTLTSKLAIELDGYGKETIAPTDFVAVGGEASIYRIGDKILKIYLDDNKMRADDMANKIRLLSKIRSAYIVAPQGVVLSKNEPIGFYMPYVEGEPLPRLFTTAYWTRSSFNVDLAKKLVDRMRDTVITAHSHNAILVDPNEANWSVSCIKQSDPIPKVFDVDSWAIDKWPAKVIVTSIRDYHTTGFNEQSDWFSWAVITFQLFTGIHPYRGTLPGYGIQLDDLVARMKANMSVFEPGVRLNRAVRDFSDIPSSLLNWYQGTFQKGERTKPPSVYDKGGPAVNHLLLTKRVVLTQSGNLRYTKLLSVNNEPVVRTFICGIVQTSSGNLYDLSSSKKIGYMTNSGELIKVQNGWLIADWNNSNPVFTFINEMDKQIYPITMQLSGKKFFRSQNRLFLINDNNMIELGFFNVMKPLVTIKQTTQILNYKATQWFDGIGIQEALLSKFLVLPFGDKSCTTIRISELDQIKIVDAKAGNRFASVLGIDKSGLYQKIELTFSSDYSSYTVWKATVASSDLNISILPKMVSATIVSDGELVIFVPTNGKVTKLQDKQISTDMQLSNWDDKVIYIQNGEVWSVSS